MPRSATWGRLSGESDRAKGNPLIQAAHAVAPGVDRHVGVAGFAHRAEDLLAPLGLLGAGQLVGADLEARCVVVVPHTADAKAQAANAVLGTFDHAQRLV